MGKVSKADSKKLSKLGVEFYSEVLSSDTIWGCTGRTASVTGRQILSVAKKNGASLVPSEVNAHAVIDLFVERGLIQKGRGSEYSPVPGWESRLDLEFPAEVSENLGTPEESVPVVEPDPQPEDTTSTVKSTKEEVRTLRDFYRYYLTGYQGDKTRQQIIGEMVNLLADLTGVKINPIWGRSRVEFLERSGILVGIGDPKTGVRHYLLEDSWSSILSSAKRLDRELPTAQDNTPSATEKPVVVEESVVSPTRIKVRGCYLNTEAPSGLDLVGEPVFTDDTYTIVDFELSTELVEAPTSVLLDNESAEKVRGLFEEEIRICQAKIKAYSRLTAGLMMQ